MDIPFLISQIFLILRIFFITKVVVLLLGGILVAVQFIAGIDVTLSFATQVQGPASHIMGQMYDVFTSMLPFSLDDVIDELDTAIGSLNAFDPPMTFKGFWITFGLGDAFNRVIQCFLVGLNFVLSVRFFRWALSKFGLKFI